MSVGRQIIALRNCIPKSNYNYNSINFIVVNCIFILHIISITKTPNGLTSLGVYFMIIIKTKERKRESPSRPKRNSPFKVRVKNSYKTTIMIRLFSQLCKYFKQTSLNNEIYIFNTYISSIDEDALICPICGAKHSLSLFATYARHLVTYNNNTAHNNIITILRYICSSCEHTHAILPSVIIPYMSFSFQFTISIIHDYLIHKFHSVEAMCEHYGIAITTFYRIFKNFKEHKKLWLGLLEYSIHSSLSFIEHMIRNTFIELDGFMLSFFKKTALSFFQESS